jgi:hypothetical protein
MDTDDAIRALICFFTFLCGVYAGAGMGAIGEYERALKDVTTDGVDFTLKVWNKQHPEREILHK